MKVVQVPSLEWYAINRSGSTIHLVRHSPYSNNSKGRIHISDLHLPFEFIGKKVIIKIEVVEEKR